MFILFYYFATLWRGNLREAELMMNRDFPHVCGNNNRNHAIKHSKCPLNKPYVFCPCYVVLNPILVEYSVHML